MRKSLYILLIALIAISFADAPKIKYPELNPINIPDHEKFVLPNGMTIYLMEDHEFPVMTAYFRIEARSSYDPPEKLGLCELTNDMIRIGGAGDMMPDDVDLFLESIGAKIDVDANVNRSTVTAKCLTDNFEEVFALVAEMIQDPMFEQEKYDWHKKQWQGFLMQRNDNADNISEREYMRCLLGKDHPYARIEEVYTLDAVNRDDLVEFHEKYYVPANIDLGIVGDFDTKEIKGLIEKHFGDFEGEMPQKPEIPPFPEKIEPKVFFAQKDGLIQSTIRMGHLGIQEDSTDYYAANLITQILGAGRAARLYKEIRVKRGWVYSVYGFIGSGLDNPSQSTFYVQTRAKNTVEAIELVKQEIKKFQSEPPTDEEVETAKETYKNSYPFQFVDPLSILRQIMVYDYYGYPKDFQEKKLDRVLAVEKEEVMEASNRLLRPDNMAILIVGDTATVENIEKLGNIKFVDLSIPTEAPGSEKAEIMDDETLKRGQEIVDNAIVYCGGREKIESVKDISIKAKMTQKQGQMAGAELEAQNCYVFDDDVLMRGDIKAPFGQITQGYDGKKAWIAMPQGSRYLEGNEAASVHQNVYSNLLSLFDGYIDGRVTANFIGMDEFREKQAAQVEMSIDDFSAILYIDPESGEIFGKSYKTTGMQGPVTYEEFFAEMKQVQGVRLPHKIITKADGHEYSETMVESMDINKGFEKAEFAKPE
ncbi:MAG: M16 family metallopeptidase [Candidatus Zixiibacteriota bacterium]